MINLKDKKLCELTLKNIIESKIDFINNNSIFNKEEYMLINNGELNAYKEILIDIELMNENEFVEKYLGIIQDLSIKFESNYFGSDAGKVFFQGITML